MEYNYDLFEELNFRMVGYMKLKKKKICFLCIQRKREFERDQIWEWEMELCFEKSIYLRLLNS